ncbi:AAA family ATPase, partial [Desulfococcaceae bacterium HSG8]|nr:AAA family ATPase [Desulfococcaceae bacterium HSG8]
MLIEFKVGNFLSFKDVVNFSMIASPDEAVDTTFSAVNKFQLLKSAVIYGANASGKSNLLKAVAFMRRFVFESSKESQATENINVSSFRLSTECEKEPSFFEVIFICNQRKFRYGFEVDKNEVHSEWLFFVPTRTEAKLFIREKGNIKIGNYFKEGKGLENRTRSNALFLSVAAQFNGEISTRILTWFKSLNVISGLDDNSYIGFTLKRLENEKFL